MRNRQELPADRNIKRARFRYATRDDRRYCARAPNGSDRKGVRTRQGYSEGLALNLQDFQKLIRARWTTILVTLLVATGASAFVTLVTTPLYQASTRLFVSASAATSVTDIYQGNRFSQERVASYVELLTGETLAQRTVDKLSLNITADDLREKVKATAKPQTVLIDVSVTDKSPTRAQNIANALSDEFVVMVRELESPQGASPDARVVVEQRASTPSAPVSPKKTKNILLGVVVGLALGIGLAILRDLLDNTVKGREALEEIAQVGVVGEIQFDKERLKVPAINFGKDTSAIAESFRKLRTNLSFLRVDDPPRVIVVTSSIPAEGKSTGAINIALALAEAENNVLLVDGDMRRPAVHKYLNLVGSVGFSTVLTGAVPLADALQSTQFERLTVLAAGVVPPNPSELLGSHTAEKVLADLRGRFDYVIVDSSPLLAVTDAAILAAHSDGALIMVRYGQTKRDQLVQAVTALRDVGAPLLGAVLTMITRPGSGAYSYSYYGKVKPGGSRFRHKSGVSD